MNFSQLTKYNNYKFKKQRLLETALTHSSYANEHKNIGAVCNERLEFVGDSFWALSVQNCCIPCYPEKPEGEMSKMRSSLVCETALAEYAALIDLGSFLLLGHGEDTAGGRERPSTVSDAFEALIAAIYLDGGLESARKFVLPFLIGALDSNKYTHVLNRDYKTMLQEIAQQNPGEIIHYEIVGESGPDHNKNFTVSVYLNSNLLATANGKSKKEAEQKRRTKH